MRQLLCASLAVVIAVAAAHHATLAAEHRALPKGTLPDDSRLGPRKDLNGYFPFAVPESRESWEARAALVRRQAQVALGLWPLPTKTPLNAVIHGRVERDDYTVERVYFESWPGHFVTGSLYRPKRFAGKRPVVLCPHGHWDNGRFYDAGADQIRGQLVAGAERFEISGRYPLQARCVQLARMGCVVFHYDMLGYADSQQLVHRPDSRDHMNTLENWGFLSPQAELRLQTMMGLQTYNSIRSLDFVSELHDVDMTRVGVTGASGGGTQTLILGAVDERPAVSFPAVMVSTAMQGGCTCENCSYLRVGTGNIELAALVAPKPLGMTAADDWTHEIETKGLPELKALYAVLGAPNDVMAAALTHFPHNYNYVSRAAMYPWMNRHLKFGFDEPIVEDDFVPLSIDEMSVWNDKHARPPSGDEYERSLLAAMTEDAERQMKALAPVDKASLDEFRKVVGGAIETLVGRTVARAGAIEWENLGEFTGDNYMEFDGVLRNSTHDEVTPVVFLHPDDWNQEVVVWADERGKAGLFESDDSLRGPVRRLVDAGYTVVGVDLLYQGEFLADGQPLDRQPMVENTRWKYAGYTFGYNYPLFCQRVHDLLGTIACVRDSEHDPQAVHLIGLGAAGAWAAAAAAVSGDALGSVVVDTHGFRFASLNQIDHPNFVPGVVKYGDLPAMLALAAPARLCVIGDDDQQMTLVRQAYRAAGAADRLTLLDAGSADKVVDWLAE